MTSRIQLKKTILVAGGAGFIGAQLCSRLLSNGANVICIDNLQTGRAANLADMMGKTGFSFIKHDVIHPLIMSQPIDEIYNLACPASPSMYQIDPVHTLKTSVLGALNLLRLARNKGARILQASTSEVYGDPQFSPQAESYHGNVNPVGPRSCYDEGKRAAETLFRDYGVQHGVTTKIARIFNTYGPGMTANDGRVVSNFIMQALQDRPITLYGNGLQTRSFCFVNDLLDGLIRLMSMPPDVSFPINLGNDGEFTIAELADMIIRKTGSVSEIIQLPLPIDDPRQRCPDLSLARKVLNWQPKVSLDQGLDLTIPWFRRAALMEARAIEVLA
ncbi:UDP-glucuronic acid decarboxylase family protein [Roseicyclus marinus]|uniref:UDP-glucuronic acid decarboxylase family protein n=1 Tax=Roseicyclus marinus TaxID=2161673 RepID=UPI00240EEC4B|nr:UDP-glucuronic acid decarboxylase family protein [Roseicyclus marinus]MDG3042764.1 SDR family oxidoreductase [Roseicyclus marinus]